MQPVGCSSTCRGTERKMEVKVTEEKVRRLTHAGRRLKPKSRRSRDAATWPETQDVDLRKHKVRVVIPLPAMGRSISQCFMERLSHRNSRTFFSLIKKKMHYFPIPIILKTWLVHAYEECSSKKIYNVHLSAFCRLLCRNCNFFVEVRDCKVNEINVCWIGVTKFLDANMLTALSRHQTL